MEWDLVAYFRCARRIRIRQKNSVSRQPAYSRYSIFAESGIQFPELGSVFVEAQQGQLIQGLQARAC
jgi:hypothetical protein